MKTFPIFILLLLITTLNSYGQCKELGELRSKYCEAAVAVRCAAKMTACEDKRNFLLKMADFNQCQADNFNNQEQCSSLLPRNMVIPSCPQDEANYPTQEAAQKYLSECAAAQGVILPGATASGGSSTPGASTPGATTPGASDFTGSGQGITGMENQTALGLVGHLMMNGDTELQNETENIARETQLTFLQSGNDATTSQVAGDAVRLIGGFSSLAKKKKSKKEAKAAALDAQRKAQSTTGKTESSPPTATEPETQPVTQSQDQFTANPEPAPAPTPTSAIRSATFAPIEENSSATEPIAVTKHSRAKPKTGYEYDLIIKTKPEELIAGHIKYETDAIINYQSINGNSASINKKNITAILYKDGQTQFLSDSEKAVSTLERLLPQAEKYASDFQKTTIEDKDTPLLSESENPVLSASATQLSTDQYQTYRKQALNKLDDFVQFLNIITDKDLDGSEKDKAIEEAQKLFLPDATIAVTSANKPGARQYKVKDYLTRLKLLPYRSTVIEWNEVSYVKELEQASDGNYYGMITGQQTFKGYNSNGKGVAYSDITQKNVKVKLQSYQKSVDGQAQKNWEVLLGNIGIAVNQ